MDDDIKKENKTVGEAPKKKAPFAYWTVDGIEHKLKLTAPVICQIEEKLKCRNLLSVLDGNGSGLPSLGVMLTIIQGALKTWEHGIKYTDVQTMFDKYVDEGGTQLTLLTDVLLPIYSVSGFFSETQREEMEKKQEEIRDLL